MLEINIPPYRAFSVHLASKLHRVIAMVNAMECLAHHHEDGESDQTLIDLVQMARLARESLCNVATVLDRSESCFERTRETY